MSGVSDLTGRSFRRLVVLESLGLSAVTLFLVSLYLWALLRMSPEQLGFFVRCISGLFVVLFVLSTLVNERIHGAIGRCLDRRCEAQAGPEELRSGYAALVALPRISFLVGWAWWAGGGVLVAAAMRIRFQSFPWLSVAIMVVAAVSVGLVSMILHYFVLKRMLEPYHSALAAEVGDVFVRRKLMSHVPLTQKLVITVVGVTAVSLGFAVTLAQVRSDLAIEGFATRLQREALHRASLQLGAGQNLDRVRTASEVVSVRLLLLDAAAEHVIDGPPSLLLADEIRALREVGPEGGDSTAFDTPNAFAWRRLADGTVLVAVSPPDTVWPEYSDVTAILGIFTLLALGIAVTAARLAASDISRVTLALRGEVERMAGGDLTPGRTIESEDEVGHLARGFERMSLALRGTVSGVVDAAGGVEATAGELARVAEDLASVTDDQVLGIQQAKTSMDRINGEVDGVATSAHQLSVSVEESSSAILELGVTGEELSENASVLSERVAEVGTSIEQMSQSAERVRHFSEELAGASADTSASMTEMAQTLGEVDGNAAETARLSHRMVELAETGHQKVAETIRGMDSIREATDTAQSVIHTLGGRAQEIGSIVQVIHDVADETNLLALNAAIIAAQAGEHGRAFSVVADEIKDLADRVITSTKEIDGLIHGLQDESRNAIGAIEGGADRVRVGVEMSAEAGVALEQITAAARESGGRIAEIVSAVQEQSQASAHVVRLMEKVRYGVDQIREAGDEQSQGNAVVLRGANEMRQVAQQVSAATQEQARGAHRMRDGIENIRDAVERINSSLQKQSKGCRQVAEVLERVHGRTHQNDESARRMRDAMSGLSQQAEALRQGVRHFRV